MLSLQPMDITQLPDGDHGEDRHVPDVVSSLRAAGMKRLVSTCAAYPSGTDGWVVATATWDNCLIKRKH
jgi:hypothetical protein